LVDWFSVSVGAEALDDDAAADIKARKDDHGRGQGGVSATRRVSATQ
jgi:hypothetical protein